MKVEPVIIYQEKSADMNISVTVGFEPNGKEDRLAFRRIAWGKLLERRTGIYDADWMLFVPRSEIKKFKNALWRPQIRDDRLLVHLAKKFPDDDNFEKLENFLKRKKIEYERMVWW